MTAQPLEFRMAQIESSMSHLGGSYEQIDKRLGDLRTDANAAFVRIDQHLDSLDRKIDGSFKTLIGWSLGQTGVIVGAIAAVAFALRH